MTRSLDLKVLSCTGAMSTDSLPSTFQAAQYANYGEKTIKLVELPMLVPKANELLVKVEAASINPVDWKLQTGALKMLVPLKLPIVPSMDFSGVVVAVGEGVTKFAVGDHVVTSTAPKVQGALAGYAIATVNATAKRPPSVSASDAAAIPIAALTAYVGLKQSGVKFDGSYKGRILILNAAGGVGTFAVQMAKIAGAYVVATCGARNLDLVKGLGANEVLDYKSDAVTNWGILSGDQFDAIYHASHVTDLNKLLAGIKDKGTLLMLDVDGSLLFKSLLNNFNPFAKKKMVTFLLSTKLGSDLDVVLEWMEQGQVKVITDSTFPLSKADEAWAKSIDGHAVGKIIVTVP